MLSEVIFENAKTAIQCPVKQSFFLAQNLGDFFLVRGELWEDASKFRHHRRRQFREESSCTEPEVAPEEDLPELDPSVIVVSIGVARNTAIRYC